MGNKNSCCASSPVAHRKECVEQNEEVVRNDDFVSNTNLQHISERELQDYDTDPSVHPKART